MASNKITQLKSALGSGARSSKYRVNFSVPASVKTTSNLQNVDILCKATSFPSMTIGQIEVFNQGRKLIIPGDTSYTTTWTVTFYNTEDHNLRRDLIEWMRSADDFQNNSHSGNPDSIMGELGITQLDSKGNPTTTYTFHNVFVQEVAEISVGDDQVDAIQEFDVTFSFTDWVVGTGEFQATGLASPATLNDIA